MPTLRFAGYQPAASIHTQAVRRLGEIMTRTAGDGFAFEQTVSILDLGHKAGDLAPLVADGAYAMCYMSTIRFVADVPALGLFDAPFVIADRERVWRALDGAFGDALKAAFAARTPYRLLGFWDNGFRQISNRVRPIRTPADCRGLTIRTQINDDIVEMFRRIGFEPVPIDISEAVPALREGRIDAQENPLTSINAFGIQRIHRHVTLTGHIFGVALVLCNAAQYESWPAPFRTLLHDAVGEASRYQRALAAEQDDTLTASFAAEGVEFVHLTDSERSAFVEAARPVTDRLTAAVDAGLLKRLRE
jgi:C4-dicarboxylate-binding protein DctP